MFTKVSALAACVAALCAPLSSHAWTVQQWQGNGAGGGGLATSLSIVNSFAANTTVQADVIDYSDTNSTSYNGRVAGFSAWPLAGDFNAGSAQNSNFVARVTGQFQIDVADTYFFGTFNDDGLQLLIDGVAVITDNSYHPASNFVGSKALSAGLHTVDLVFFEQGGEAVLELTMARGSSTNTFNLLRSVNPNDVPEPGSLALVGAALLGAGLARRRKA